MVFYVFFEPRVITDAANTGPLGIPFLINILKGFQQNCILLDFLDSYTARGVEREVSRLEEEAQREERSPDEVKRLKAVLVHLKKTNRFVYVIEPDWVGTRDHLSILEEQCETLGLDIIMIAEDQEIDAVVESTSLAAYQLSDFETRRAAAVCGRTYPAGAMPQLDFMESVFGKLMRHARRIDIYDGIVSRHWGDNFQHTLEQLLIWLGRLLPHPGECKLILHTEDPTGQTDKAIETHLRSCRAAAGLHSMPIEVQYYDPRTMPHDRFIVTESLSIGIGRGMDFLNHQPPHYNRDVTIAILDDGSTAHLLRGYEGCRTGTPRKI